MEQHGNNPSKNVVAIIPARYASTRLPGKLLLPIAGRPLILHTLEQARKARNIDRVIVATDDERIRDAVLASGGEAVMTRPGHHSGSDRIAEVASALPAGSIIVNVQGDEPVIAPSSIEAAVDGIINDPAADIVTTCEQIDDIEDVLSPDIVKVVTGANGYAIYFSRSAIPFPREAATLHGGLKNALANEPGLIASFRKHTGLYVYTREFLLEFTKLRQGLLERAEMLEQLRALEAGARIKVVETAERSIGVDTQSDLEKVRRMIEAAVY